MGSTCGIVNGVCGLLEALADFRRSVCRVNTGWRGPTFRSSRRDIFERGFLRFGPFSSVARSRAETCWYVFRRFLLLEDSLFDFWDSVCGLVAGVSLSVHCKFLLDIFEGEFRCFGPFQSIGRSRVRPHKCGFWCFACSLGDISSSKSCPVVARFRSFLSRISW